MKISGILFGERSLTKMAGFFSTPEAASETAADIRRAAVLDAPQVRLINPGDGIAMNSPAFSRKMEPESRGIWRTLVRTHVILGVVGLCLSVMVYLLYLAFSHEAVTSTPVMSLVAMSFLGATIGLLVGGLLTARPDHGWVIAAVRRASRRGHWAVVVHPVTDAQRCVSWQTLRTHTRHAVRSF